MEAAFSIQAISAVVTVDGSLCPARECHGFRGNYGSHDHDLEELFVLRVTTTTLDVAKSVFQVHGIDAAGQVRDTTCRDRIEGVGKNYGHSRFRARRGRQANADV